MRRLGLFAALALIGSCGSGDFEPQSKIESVRILASRVDKPYAKPGETVSLELLAYDGRRKKERETKIYWIPFPCMNPRNDLYYACFIPQAGQADAGTGSTGSGFGALRAGVDLTPYLPTGATYSFKMPDNAIATHPPVQG